MPPRRRATPRQLAERALRRMIDDLSAARLRVAKIEADIAEMTGLLGGAAIPATARELAVSVAPVGPVERVTLPAALAVQALPQADIPEHQEPPIDLAGEDNMGSGRWA